jgi:hypothetical protein
MRIGAGNLERRKMCASLEIPQPDGLIGAAAGKGLSVRTYGHGLHTAGVPDVRVDAFAGARQHPAIWADGDIADQIRMHRISELAGIKIDYVSVGPERD